jgi:ActR/RegA family two-component response regulator
MHAKVLLVDDEAPFIETLAKRLSKRDLTIVTAFSGAEALQKLDMRAHESLS